MAVPLSSLPKKKYAKRTVPAIEGKAFRIEIFSFLYRFLWVLFFFVTAFVLFFSPLTEIKSVRMSGTESVSSEEVTAFIFERMQPKLAMIFPGNNFFTLDCAALSGEVKEHFPVLKTVEVEKVFPGTVKVSVTERKTAAIWCSNGECFAVDESGVAYAGENSVRKWIGPEDAHLRVNDESGRSVSEGDALITHPVAEFFRVARDRLRDDLGIFIESDASVSSRFSTRLKVKTSEGWTLSLNVETDPERLINALRLLLQKEITDERRAKLRFVDMGSETRAHYSVEGEGVMRPELSEDAKDEQKEKEKR